MIFLLFSPNNRLWHFMQTVSLGLWTQSSFRGTVKNDHTAQMQRLIKTYNKTCAASEDSDQPVHQRSLISLHWLHVPSTAFGRSKEGWREILAIRDGCTGWSESAGYAGIIVGFAVRWLISRWGLFRMLCLSQNFDDFVLLQAWIPNIPENYKIRIWISRWFSSSGKRASAKFISKLLIIMTLNFGTITHLVKFFLNLSMSLHRYLQFTWACILKYFKYGIFLEIWKYVIWLS